MKTVAELEQSITNLEQLIVEATPTTLPRLVGIFSQLHTTAELRARTYRADTPPPQPAQIDRYLTVEQVCERFNVKEDWVYRHKKKMPHSQPSRKVVLFPEQAISRWFASRRGV